MDRKLELQLTRASIACKTEVSARAIAQVSENRDGQYIAHLQDANERLRRENEEIRRALEEEQKRSQKRAQLIPMLVHELISPLNVISFAASTLKRRSTQWTEEKKQAYLGRIQTALQQLNELMDEVLLVGRAEAKKLSAEPTQIDLKRFCQDLATQLQLDDRNEHIINFIYRGDRSTVCIDRKWLQPILTNLLSNAIKYSPAGSAIDLMVSCEDEKVIFQIQDKGIGIPEADRKKLFEPFYRGRNASYTSGSGLGLTIVKNLVDLHGGCIEVASEAGVGTTFTVVLPIKKDS
ncbi:MAG: HAMP domain-containing histidine kinase [Hydrococcus sp. Prado102]|nr:HAMP domain-containing histidine kinase [Hydrococcus sp. Prado102]